MRKASWSGLLAGWLVVCALPGCLPVSQQVRRTSYQRLQIRTDPPGATVWLQGDDGVERLGPSPVELDVGYNAVIQHVDQGACAANGAGEGLLAGLAAADDGPEAAILGLLGMTVGAAAGAAACSQGDGVVSIEPNHVELVATLDHYLPTRRVVEVPHRSGRITLGLIPAPASGAAPASPTAPPSRVAPRPLGPIAVGPLAVEPLVIDPTGQGLGDDAVERLTGALVEALEDEDVPLASPEQPAVQVLAFRVLHREELCLFSATLYSLSQRRPLRVVGASGGCDPDGLQGSLERIAAQLGPEGQQSLVEPPPEQEQAPAE